MTDLEKIEQLEREVKRLSALLKIERKQSAWLDVLADELRDGGETQESIDLFEDFTQTRKRLREELKDEGIDI